MRRNASERKQAQFHQGQCDVAGARGTGVYRIHKFPDNLKKYLPKLFIWYHRYQNNSFLGLVHGFWQQKSAVCGVSQTPEYIKNN